MNGVIILGTASDAGKSMIATALCRILANENIQVTPFKSQNLSSFTEKIDDGKEISRAQFIQAEAAKTTASIDMNPIMLKIRQGMRTKVSILGVDYGEMEGFSYREKYFDHALSAIRKSLQQLSKQYETVIIEGAGSPAEVNLNDREVVNMRVAEIADVPALLVVPIDKGGAIAAIVGTLALLSPAHRQRVKGIIVNKFRGDVSLFQEGVDFIESYTGIPVVGVIPYQENHGIEEEDVARPVTKVPVGVDIYEEWAKHVKQYLDWPAIQKIIAQGGA